MPRLVLAIHNHQPVGNFDHVIEQAYQRAYRPWLDVLARHPRVRTCLHQPGILWEWLAAHHPEYLETAARLVADGRLELISGGYYEPILSVIPANDRRLQLTRLGKFLHKRFGVRPRGAWLAERVWEPHLAETLASAGLDYTVVDDSHFKGAGHDEAELDGYFMTEEGGRLLRVFPISQKLRYSIPFAEPEVTLGFLERWRDRADAILVHADDGEKFGVWPGTYHACYEQGWLDRFLEMLEANAAWLQTATFSECIDSVPPRGRTYLPTASYAEMGEWALPPAAQRKLHRAIDRLDSATDGEELKIFVRGGFWRNFLARYPESNWMHKKMLWVSRKRDELERRRRVPDRAVENLLAAQCNCAYWHGLFGGLYLPHLRSAIYRHLIRAEVVLDGALHAPAAEIADLDADGQPEVLLRSDALLAVIKPDRGGALFELDDRHRCFNLLDLMTRREEAYHDKLRALQPRAQAAGDAAVSIHDLVAAKEPGLAERLHFDAYRRGAFIDHVLAPAASLADFAQGKLSPALAQQAYAWALEGERLQLRTTWGPEPVQLTKTYRLAGDRLDVEYVLEADRAARFRLGVEIAVNLLAGHAHDRYYESAGRRLDPGELASQGVLDACRDITLVDEWLGVRVRVDASAPASVWRAPIETISMSESGFERVFQGSALLFAFDVVLARDVPWIGTLSIGIGPLSA